jgi:hypothetical protein
MRLATVLSTLCILACTAPAAAQVTSLRPGDRVRLLLESKQQVTGQIVSATADSLTLRIHPEATPTTLPVAALRSLEVSLGKPSPWTSGVNAAVLGAGVVGAQFGLSEGAEGNELGKHVGWGATLGAALGLTLGSIFREERWSSLSTPQSSVELAQALRFPSMTFAGGWGTASGRAGRGRGGGARLSAGIARLDEDAHLRAELSFERSTLESEPIAYSEELGLITSHEENRRYSFGLTVVENAWRIGERVQTYFSFGVGATQSRVIGERFLACGEVFPCSVGGVAYRSDSTRSHRGTYALGGFGLVARVLGTNVFAEIRSQMMDDGAQEPGTFTPFSLGVSF